MKQPDRENAFPRQVRTFPLSLLSLSRGKRLLIIAVSYVLGVVGLWILFPLVHNGGTMLLPVVSACWLFRYRGMLISLVLNGILFQLTYYLLLRGLLPDQDYIEGAAIGFGTSLALGFVVCWLRTAVDQVHIARQQAQAAEQERLLILLREQQTALAYEQQRKLNNLKDQFLLNVSHELRTPLTVLGGTLELFSEFYEHLDPVKRESLLQEAIASQTELADLVNRVLDAASVVGEVPEVKLEVVCIHQILQDVLAHLAPAEVQAYTFHLQVPEQVRAWADPQFLRQVLRNLLTNVFKYVPPQTEIRIEATQADSTSPVCLSVQDAGPGIPAEELPLLFEKFVRLKRDLAGSTRGTGLGLYICKQLVEAMGGRIWVESSGRTGDGSRFCVTLSPFLQ